MLSEALARLRELQARHEPAGPVQHEPAGQATPKPTPDAETGVPRDQGSVRVSLTKLDTLLTESGELAVTQLRIAQRFEMGDILLAEQDEFNLILLVIDAPGLTHQIS